MISLLNLVLRSVASLVDFSILQLELAGLSTGLMSPYVVHIGLDNLGVVQKGNDIHADAISRSRPWCLQVDGDMWQLVDSLLQQRGANSAHIRWVKEHVSLLQLGQGYSVRDAVFNSYADAAAERAHRHLNQRLQHEILGFFGKKQQDLVKALKGKMLMCDVAQEQKAQQAMA